MKEAKSYPDLSPAKWLHFVMKPYLSRICMMVLVVVSPSALADGPKKVPPKSVSANPDRARPAATALAPARKSSEWETFKEPGLFVMALARDGAGNVWVGTEGNGVWRFDPEVRTNQWTQF